MSKDHGRKHPSGMTCQKQCQNAMAVCILSELHMFLNGRTVTSEYHVTTSCKNNLKPALPWNGYHGDVTQTQLVIGTDSAILSRIVSRYIRYLL